MKQSKPSSATISAKSENTIPKLSHKWKWQCMSNTISHRYKSYWIVWVQKCHWSYCNVWLNVWLCIHTCICIASWLKAWTTHTYVCMIKIMNVHVYTGQWLDKKHTYMYINLSNEHKSALGQCVRLRIRTSCIARLHYSIISNECNFRLSSI